MVFGSEDMFLNPDTRKPKCWFSEANRVVAIDEVESSRVVQTACEAKAMVLRPMASLMRNSE